MTILPNGCHAGLTVSHYGEVTTQDVLMRGGGVTLSSPLGRGDGEWGEVKQNLFFLPNAIMPR